MKNDDLEDLISIAEAARIRDVTHGAIQDLLRRGKLSFTEIGGRKLLSRKEVEEFEPESIGRPPILINARKELPEVLSQDELDFLGIFYMSPRNPKVLLKEIPDPSSWRNEAWSRLNVKADALVKKLKMQDSLFIRALVDSILRFDDENAHYQTLSNCVNELIEKGI